MHSTAQIRLKSLPHSGNCLANKLFCKFRNYFPCGTGTSRHSSDQFRNLGHCIKSSILVLKRLLEYRAHSALLSVSRLFYCTVPVATLASRSSRARAYCTVQCGTVSRWVMVFGFAQVFRVVVVQSENALFVEQQAAAP